MCFTYCIPLSVALIFFAADNEKEKKKKKSKKMKKKKKTKDGGVTPGGPMVEATYSTNATAATQGVHVGTERRG